MMETLEIPNKSLFKLNEVCGLTGVKPYVLRFWESEFHEIEPVLSSTGQKLYEPKDVQAIATIKHLLFDEKMNIEQAKAVLARKLEEELEEDEESIEGTQEQSFERITSFEEADIPEVPHMARVQVQRASLSDSDLENLLGAQALLREIVNF